MNRSDADKVKGGKGSLFTELWYDFKKPCPSCGKQQWTVDLRMWEQ
jgi:hypothetical protein